MSSKKLSTAPSEQTTAHHDESWETDTIYSVYIHHKRNEDIENLICWERRESTKNRDKAINSARTLYKSHDCDKVEVKKTYHNTKLGKMTDKTIKTYGKDSIEAISCPVKLAIAILGTALCTVTAMWLWG